MGDKTLKRGRKCPQDVQKMNATTTTTTNDRTPQATVRTIPNEAMSLADAMDAFKGVKYIMNTNGRSRVVRIYWDPWNKDFYAVGVNGRVEWFVGCHANSIQVSADGMATLAWAWGHYFCDASNVFDDVDGMKCVWDLAIDGGF